VAPLPKFQLLLSVPLLIILLLENWKVLPVRHWIAVFALKIDSGIGCTVTNLVVLSLQPLLLVDTSLTVYVPGAAYDLVALSVIAVPPSPKFQLCWVSEPAVITELLVKVKLLPDKHCPVLLILNAVDGIGFTTTC
jgi:hypothetical protein